MERAAGEIEYLAGEWSVDGVWQVPKQAGSFASARQMTLLLNAEVLAFGEFGGTNIFFFTIKSFLRQALEDSCLYLWICHGFMKLWIVTKAP